jgi:ankyrin repeat protein
MHLAVNMGNISTVQVLVEAGADVHAKDKVSIYYMFICYIKLYLYTLLTYHLTLKSGWQDSS